MCVRYRFAWQSDLIARSIICVAGAGRGPLVSRSLKAVQRAKKEAFVYAVEKNPNAFVTCVLTCMCSRPFFCSFDRASLQGRKAKEWGSSVELIAGDMRRVAVPEPADILVSELLGSFGDNELSPECLDGAMRFLKRKHIRASLRDWGALMDMASGWHLNTVILHGAPRTSVLIEATQRCERDQGSQGRGNAVRSDVPKRQHPQW